uniref:Histidine N-acetyltransferase C-terminal domain-containing protein n=1 Tax=Hucho hucho TaxID=62062 RepID=A0A4W5MD71_9TELE
MDSRVVVSESVLLVDGGETIVVQGLWVAPSVRGQGITGAIQRHVTVFACRLVRRLFLKLGTLMYLSSCLWQGILSLCCEVGDIGPFLEELQQRLDQEYKAEAFNPVTLSQAEAEKAVLSTYVVANLLPGGTIINNWEPLNLMEDNLEVLRRRGLTWVADCPLRPNALSLCTRPHPVPYCHVALHLNINVFWSHLEICANQMRWRIAAECCGSHAG